MIQISVGVSSAFHQHNCQVVISRGCTCFCFQHLQTLFPLEGSPLLAEELWRSDRQARVVPGPSPGCPGGTVYASQWTGNQCYAPILHILYVEVPRTDRKR